MKMAWLTLGLFCACLILCLTTGIPILWALGAGLVLFLLYGRRKGFGWKALLGMALRGIRTVKDVLIAFLLIGILTALWRSAGTIPTLVCSAASLIRPGILLLMTFLLNCVVSVLTGSAFSTGATMGVICAAMGAVMGLDLRLVGGAILSGCYFGDRCSPVSTSALLVAGLTKTDIFDNLKRMARSALAPFLLSCAVYGLLGLSAAPTGQAPDLYALFSREFTLHWAALAPAAVILILSALRVGVKPAMGASILTAALLCLLLQHRSPLELLTTALTGFHSADGEAEAMLGGGGVTSMLRVAGIVCLSSSYSDIFRQTGLLDGAKRAVRALSGRATPYLAALITSALAGVVACNQTLTVMMTHQLCFDLRSDPADLALDLEDTAVVTAPLIPWSIAGSVPLTAVGAPLSAIAAACYLYLLPLWRGLASLLEKRRGTAHE